MIELFVCFFTIAVLQKNLFVKGSLGPPTGKIVKVDRNYFVLNISVTVLDKFCNRKNEKIEFILLNSKLTRQTHNDSLQYCIYHLEKEIISVFPKKVVKKTSCSTIKLDGYFLFYVKHLEAGSFYCTKLFYQAYKGLELLKSESSYVYVKTRPSIYHHEILILVIAGVLFGILMFIGYKFKKKYFKYRKNSTIDKENKNKGYNILHRTLLERSSTTVLDSKNKKLTQEHKIRKEVETLFTKKRSDNSFSVKNLRDHFVHVQDNTDLPGD